MPTRTPPALVRLALALAVCLLAGVALAGLAFPLIGGVGLAAKSTSDAFLDLPSALPAASLARSSKILDKDGGTIAVLFAENRVPVKLARIPVSARKALISIEDSRFYEHNGIDVKGTARALARNSSSGSVQQGGSTLTQQYVKNTLVENARGDSDAQKAAVARSAERKLQEARYALALEKRMTKDQILEGYFNIAYYGNGVYGIGTAAGHYFGKPVERLTLAEGALLAGMVQNPRKYDPQDNPKNALARRNVVLDRMAELGEITPAQLAAARRERVNLKITQVTSGCEAPAVTAPFFCDYVRRWLEDGPGGAGLGETRQERQEALFAGGLTIRTTLDPVVQKAAQQAVDEQVPAKDPFGAAAVADTVEPGTGLVRAMAVDRRYGTGRGETKVNLALGGSLGFQGGSTFKAFTLAAALKKGISPGLRIYSPGSYCPKAFPYKTASGKCPGNSEPAEAGNFDLVSGTWASVNTFYLQLAERTGLSAPLSIADALGVRLVDGTFEGKKLRRGEASFVLGAPSVSPLAMAAAYAAFAGRGVYCPPKPVTEVLNAAGKPVKLGGEECGRVLDRDVADTVNGILRGVVNGRGSHTGGAAAIGRPVAGKTGTTNESTAAWFVGYTPQLSTAVWVGKPKPTPMRRVTINGRYYRQVFGGTIPARIFAQLMTAAHRGLPVEGFVGAQLTSRGVEATVPDVTGLPVETALEQLRAAGFGTRVLPAVNGAPLPAQGVISTSPPAGAQAPAGSTVAVLPSNGLRPVAPTATATPSPTPVPVPTKPAPTTGPTPGPPTPGPTKTKGPKG